MGISGTQRTPSTGTFTKKIGVFAATVLAVNPDKDELKELTGREVEEDIEYLGETKDGDVKLNVVFYVQDEAKIFYPVRFNLINKPRESRKPENAGDEWKPKKQYINISGVTSWADKEENLPDWFKKREYRQAFVGEEEFYNFVRSWLNKLDWNTNEGLLDWKKLTRGNTKEIADLFKSDLVGNPLCLATIHVAETEEGTKEYQQIYNKQFLPGDYLKYFKIKGKNPKAVDWFIKSIVDPTYGIKDIYTLEPLKDYNPEEHVVSGNKVVNSDDSDY